MEEGRHTGIAGFEQSSILLCRLLCSLWLADSHRQIHRTAISEHGKKKPNTALFQGKESFSLLSQQLGYAQKYEA